MELLQLKYFCDAAHTENFSKTARKYNVPASNISQSIKRLENELGISLFNRKSNSLILNQQGRQFYNKIKDALNLIDEAKSEITEDEFKGKIKICIMTNRQIAMNVMEQFRTYYPDVVIVSDYDFNEDADEYDIILADEDFNVAGIEKELFICEEIALAINKQNPLSTKDKITAEDMKNQHFICMNKGSSLYNVMEKICNQLEIEPNVVIQSPDPVFIRKCVELNLGITFFSTLSWKGLFSPDIVIKKVDGIYRKTFICYSNKKYINRHAKKFLEMLKRNVSKTMEL